MANAMVTIALPKGRIGKDALKALKPLGTESIIKPMTRKLVFTDLPNQRRYIFVKAADVVTYVERGVADLGIVGKDTIMEADANLYELLDLGFGACKFSVAGPAGLTLYQKDNVLRVATKYPKVATAYFQSKNQPVDIVYLSGSVELGPLIGLSDVIVDIVETGNTLRANGLVVYEDIADVSAKVIVNPASYRMKHHAIKTVMNALENQEETL